MASGGDQHPPMGWAPHTIDLDQPEDLVVPPIAENVEELDVPFLFHEAEDPADRIWALFESVIGRVTRGQTVALRMLSHADSDLARRIEERDNQRLSFLMSQLKRIGFSAEEARVRGQVYQAIMTGEYLRSGGLPQEERILRARDYHLMLSTKIDQ